MMSGIKNAAQVGKENASSVEQGQAIRTERQAGVNCDSNLRPKADAFCKAALFGCSARSAEEPRRPNDNNHP
jgi:hypothetical protein